MQHDEKESRDKGKEKEEKEEKKVTVYFPTATVRGLINAQPDVVASLFHQAADYAKDSVLYDTVAQLYAANRTMRMDTGIAELVIAETAIEKHGNESRLKSGTEIRDSDISRLFIHPRLVEKKDYPIDPVAQYAYAENPAVAQEKEMKKAQLQSLFDIALRLFVINHDHERKYPDSESLNEDAMLAILEKALPNAEPQQASLFAVKAFAQAKGVFAELMNNRETALRAWQELTGPQYLALWKELGNGAIPNTVKRIQAALGNGQLSDIEKVVLIREAIINRDKSLGAKMESVASAAAGLFGRSREPKRDPLTSQFYEASLAALTGNLKPLADVRIAFEMQRAELESDAVKSSPRPSSKGNK